MAKDLNKVQLTGRLGADPEMRFTPQGSAVTTFRVASNRTWKTTEGEQKEDTEWFSIVAWNKLAEICNQYLTKGSRVYIEGRLQTRSWDDQQTGEKKYRTEVVASDMIILDSRNESGPPQQRGSRPQRDASANDYNRGGGYSEPDIGDDDIPF